MAVESSVVKHKYDVTMELSDGAGTPNTLAVEMQLGEDTLDNLRPSQREVIAYQVRGAIKSVRKSAFSPATFGFPFYETGLTDATLETVIDFMRQTGSFASNVSTRGANADVYCIKVTVTIEGTDHGDAADHTFVIDDWHPVLSRTGGEPNTWTCSGETYAVPSFT